MTQPIIATLLLTALALPIIGAIGLRAVAERLTPRQGFTLTTLIFTIALASALALGTLVSGPVQLFGFTLINPAAR